MKRLFLLLLITAAPALAQIPTGTIDPHLGVVPDPQPSTRLALTTAIGSKSGLGYQLPYVAIGAGLEQIMGARAELQLGGDFSPTDKLVINSGSQVHAAARALFWLTPRFAATAADSEGWLWTSQYHKRANTPAAGIATRFWWFGLPQRAYFFYLIPTGARPTDGSLQSNRVQGLRVEDEAQIAAHLRMGITFDLLTFLSQSGAAPSPRSWTGTVVVTFRFGTRQIPNQLY